MSRIKIFLLQVCCIVCISNLSAQTVDLNNPLPKFETEAERLFIKNNPDFRGPEPNGPLRSPTSPLRSMAEWEELQALVITWAGYTSILSQIVDHAKEECEVIIICSNPTSVQNTLTQNNVDWSENVSFVISDFDSVWVRDYGPNPCYTNDVDSLVMVDWKYNRPFRVEDDEDVPVAVANFLDIPIYHTTDDENYMVHTGGNFMSDGLGLGFSSRLVVEENNPADDPDDPEAEEHVKEVMDDFMGIDEYVLMTTLEHDNISHIDMHMKIIDERTLLVGEYPEGVSDGPQIEANIQYILNNFLTDEGEPFEIVRIPMPPNAQGNFPPFSHYLTYANAIFINKTILVPTYAEPYDSEALAIWEAAMPGYNVQGINCNSMISASGALHCITKEVGVDNPLWIVHHRVLEACENEPTLVEATIKHKDGISDATVFYREAGDLDYSSILMSADGDYFSAEIPMMPAESNMEYYIQAATNTAKIIHRPMPAPEGYFSFEVQQCEITSIENISMQLEDIYPNPASAITCIPVNTNATIDAKISVLDVLGQTVEVVHEGDVPQGQSNYFIHANKYIPGTYFVELKTQNERVVQKLVVK